MHPNSMRRRADEEKECLIVCDYIEAKMIAGAVKRKYKEYDFWCVDKSGGGSGLYVGAGLEDQVFYQIMGYTTAMLDQLRGMKG